MKHSHEHHHECHCGVKVAVLILATIGLGTMWMAVFADVGVTVLAVLNAMRSLGKNRLFYR